MTGTSVLANYGKFLACLVLALVPTAFGNLYLLGELLGWRWRLPPVWAGLIVVTACALLSTAIFGLALRSGPQTPIRLLLPTGALVLAAAALPILPTLWHWPLTGLRELNVPLIAGAVFLLLVYPICIRLGARRVGWGRVTLAGFLAFTATLAGMLHVVWIDRTVEGEVALLLMAALLTLGFLPFARMEREE